MAKDFPALLKKLSDDLEALGQPATVAIVQLEFGYSHTGLVGRDGYEPIPSLTGELWHGELSEAQSAMADDKRWRSELFLISRPRTQSGGKRVELPLGYHLR